MPYFGDWLGPADGEGWVEDWWDPDVDPGPASGNGGVSKARILGTKAPRPQVPPWRAVKDVKAAGEMLTEIRRYLNEVQDRSHLWGNHVEVTFTAPDTPVRVDTGLGGPAQGYRLEGSDVAMRVYDGAPPDGDPTPERGIIWLQADAAGTARIFIY